MELARARHGGAGWFHRQSTLARKCFVSSPLHRRGQSRHVVIRAGTVRPDAVVLVAGATGGVGQLLTAKLLERGYKVRALCRDPAKAAALLGAQDRLELVYADCRDTASLDGKLEGIDAVCCTTGTTAFPSKRWDGGNGPEQTDFVAVNNLIEATPQSVQRFILTTSAGVDRTGSFPFVILNLFGVLKWKGRAEAALKASGLPFTILRPNRLTDGPYTSYDLNTLLKGVSGTRRDVQISSRDDQLEAIVQCLALTETENRTFAITSTEGPGPDTDTNAWRELFLSAI